MEISGIELVSVEPSHLGTTQHKPRLEQRLHAVCDCSDGQAQFISKLAEIQRLSRNGQETDQFPEKQRSGLSQARLLCQTGNGTFCQDDCA